MNDVSILGEKELQELGVVTDVVKQPSSAVEVENRMDVRSTPIENTQSSLPRVSLCHLLMTDDMRKEESKIVRQLSMSAS